MQIKWQNGKGLTGEHREDYEHCRRNDYGGPMRLNKRRKRQLRVIQAVHVVILFSLSHGNVVMKGTLVVQQLQLRYNVILFYIASVIFAPRNYLEWPLARTRCDLSVSIFLTIWRLEK